MQNKFSWKGFKISLIGVSLGAIALFIDVNNKSRIVLMLIGAGISFVGIFMHNVEMFKRKNKD